MDEQGRRHGRFTGGLCKTLCPIFKERAPSGIRLFCDHVDWDFPCYGQPVPYFGDYSRKTTLAHVDVAVVDIDKRRVLLMAEVEETGGAPKKVIGDIVNLYLAEHIRINGVDYAPDSFDFLLGIKANPDGAALDKLENLRLRIPRMVRPELQGRMRLEFMPRPTMAEVTSILQRRILELSGIPP